MKKMVTVILIAIMLGVLCGCNFVRTTPEIEDAKSLATNELIVIPLANEPANEPTIETALNPVFEPESEPVVDEPSAEEMWRDLKTYATKYLEGHWNGAPVMREEYKGGKEPYAYMTPDGWLHVGGIPEVIPGVTTKESFQELEKSYFDGKWSKAKYGETWLVWSEDYTKVYELNAYSGSVSLRKYDKNSKSQTMIEFNDHIGFIVSQSIEDYDLGKLAQMYRDGTWDGSLILAGADKTVRYDSSLGLAIYSASSSKWCYSYIFPSVSEDAIIGMSNGYTDQSTGRTLAILVEEKKAVLVERNGDLVATYDVKDGNEWDALIVPGAEEIVPTLFNSGDTLYTVDFENATLSPLYSGVIVVNYWGESYLNLAYQNDDRLFVAERVGGEFTEYEVAPEDYVISGNGQLSFYIDTDEGLEMVYEIKTYIKSRR